MISSNTSEDMKIPVIPEQSSGESLFGILGHRKPTEPVSTEEMADAVHERRRQRNML